MDDLEQGVQDHVEKELIEAIAKSTPIVKFDRGEKYFPCSFEYYAKRCAVKFRQSGKTLYPEGSEKEIAKHIIRELSDLNNDDVADKKEGEVTLIWKPSNGNMNELMLDVGETRGYSDITHTDHKLHGDIPHYITAYSNGIMECRHSSVKFCDVVFAVHFMWNGTMGYHACDIEEVVVRYQYGMGGNPLGYNRLRFNGILKDQGISDKNKWFVARVFLSAHGNMMAFPTRFPGHKCMTKVEFDNSRIVVYSARSSYAMYPTPGVRRRIFGFANDSIFHKNGLEWCPSQVVLWMPMYSKSGRLCDPLLIDVDCKKMAIRATPKTHPFHYLSFFRGKIGNIENCQTTAPFKSGLTNIMTDGDFYYKFQGGGLQSSVSEVFSVQQQLLLLLLTGILTLLLLVCMVVLAVMDKILWLSPVLGFVCSITTSFFILLYFVGDRTTRSS